MPELGNHSQRGRLTLCPAICLNQLMHARAELTSSSISPWLLSPKLTPPPQLQRAFRALLGFAVPVIVQCDGSPDSVAQTSHFELWLLALAVVMLPST
jgi:hypothetical protein